MSRETLISGIEIRPATPADYAAIHQIYSYYIETTTYNWNDHPKPLAAFIAGLEAVRACGRPVLVAVGSTDWAGPVSRDEQDAPECVLGFAMLHDFRAPAGYWPCVENSIYVKAGLQGHGIGSRLMKASIEQARTTGVWAIIAVIDAANRDSMQFHERHGFRHSGCLENIGEKNGIALSVVFMQLDLPENRERFLTRRKNRAQE